MFCSCRSLALLCGAFLASCVDTAGDDSGSAIDGEEFTDSIVIVHADGTIEQSTRSITAEHRQAEIAQARASGTTPGAARSKASSVQASALPVDPGCASADLWLYDSTQANRLCISGAGLGINGIDSLDLHLVRYGSLCVIREITGRCIVWANWAGRVQYIWPGSNNGRLYLDPTANPTRIFSSWGAFQAVDPAMTFVVVLLGPFLG